jgi:hypothetical protein
MPKCKQMPTLHEAIVSRGALVGSAADGHRNAGNLKGACVRALPAIASWLPLPGRPGSAYITWAGARSSAAKLECHGARSPFKAPSKPLQSPFKAPSKPLAVNENRAYAVKVEGAGGVIQLYCRRTSRVRDEWKCCRSAVGEHRSLRAEWQRMSVEGGQRS